MEADFWFDRWNSGRIGFHRAAVQPLLKAHWPALALMPGSRVLVPLCGKSHDMIWLAEQGYRVLGVELSQLAIEQFCMEHTLHPAIHHSDYGAHYVAGNIEIICGDIFGLDAEALEGCSAVYDCAALVALPKPMRAQYVRQVYGQLPRGYRGLLITLDYDQSRMAGPPFSVPDEEVQALFSGDRQALALDRRDVLADEPKFAERGLAALTTTVYELRGTRA